MTQHNISWGGGNDGRGHRQDGGNEGKKTKLFSSSRVKCLRYLSQPDSWKVTVNIKALYNMDTTLSITLGIKWG